MTIVITNNVAPKLVAVMGTPMGIFVPTRTGVAYITYDGYVDPGQTRETLADLVVDGRTPVYEGSTVVIEPGKGFTVEHTPVRELVAVLGQGGSGLFVENQRSNGVTFLDELGKPSSTYNDKTLQDVVQEGFGRIGIYSGATISFEV